MNKSSIDKNFITNEQEQSLKSHDIIDVRAHRCVGIQATDDNFEDGTVVLNKNVVKFGEENGKLEDNSTINNDVKTSRESCVVETEDISYASDTADNHEKNNSNDCEKRVLYCSESSVSFHSSYLDKEMPECMEVIMLESDSSELEEARDKVMLIDNSVDLKKSISETNAFQNEWKVLDADIGKISLALTTDDFESEISDKRMDVGSNSDYTFEKLSTSYNGEFDSTSRVNETELEPALQMEVTEAERDIPKNLGECESIFDHSDEDIVEINDKDIDKAIVGHLQLTECSGEVVAKSKNSIDKKQNCDLQSVVLKPVVESYQIVHESATTLGNLKDHEDLEANKELQTKNVSYGGLKRARDTQIHKDVDTNDTSKYSDNQEVKRLKFSQRNSLEITTDVIDDAELNFMTNNEKQGSSQENEPNDMNSIKYDTLHEVDSDIEEYIVLDDIEDNFCKEYPTSDTENQGLDNKRHETGSKVMVNEDNENSFKQPDSWSNTNKDSLSELKVENTDPENKEVTIDEHRKETFMALEMDKYKIKDIKTLNTISNDKGVEIEIDTHRKLMSLEQAREKYDEHHGNLQETFQDILKNKRLESVEKIGNSIETEAKITVTSETKSCPTTSESTASWLSSGESFMQTSNDISGNAFAIFGFPNRNSDQPPPPGDEELTPINVKKPFPGSALLPPKVLDIKRMTFPVFKKPSLSTRRSLKVSEQPPPPGCEDVAEDTWLPASKNTPVPDQNKSMKSYKMKKLQKAPLQGNPVSLFQASSVYPSAISNTYMHYEISDKVKTQTGYHKQSENNKHIEHFERVAYAKKSESQKPKEHLEHVVYTKKSESPRPKEHLERIVYTKKSESQKPKEHLERVVYTKKSESQKPKEHSERVVYTKKSESQKPKEHLERVVYTKKSESQKPEEHLERVVFIKKSDKKPKDHSERVVYISGSQRHSQSDCVEPSSHSERLIYVSSSREQKQMHQNEHQYRDRNSPKSTVSSSQNTVSSSYSHQSWTDYSSQATYPPQLLTWTDYSSQATYPPQLQTLADYSSQATYQPQTWTDYSSQATYQPQSQTKLARTLPQPVQIPMASILPPSVLMPPQPGTKDISTLKASIFAATGISEQVQPATTKSFSNTSTTASISSAGAEDLPLLVNKLKQVTQMLQLKQVLDGIVSGQQTASSTTQLENQPMVKIDQYEMHHDVRERRHSDYDHEARRREYYSYWDRYGECSRHVFDEEEDYRRWLEKRSRDDYYRQDVEYHRRPHPELPNGQGDPYYDHPQNREALHHLDPYHSDRPSSQGYNHVSIDKPRSQVYGNFNDRPREKSLYGDSRNVNDFGEGPRPPLYGNALPDCHEYNHGTIVKPVSEDRNPNYYGGSQLQNVEQLGGQCQQPARHPQSIRENFSNSLTQQIPLFPVGPQHIPPKPSLPTKVKPTPKKPTRNFNKVITRVLSRSGKVLSVQRDPLQPGFSQHVTNFSNAAAGQFN